MNARLRACLFAASLAFAALPVIAQEVMLRGALAGGNVISATDSPASGEVAAVLTDDGVLRLDMVFANMAAGATRAALHTGKSNENGPEVALLDIDSGATSGRIAGEQMTLTPLDADAVRAGESYVVISTIEYPDGAVRAQLVPQPVRLDGLPAVGAQSPPPPEPVEEPEEND